MPIRNIYNFLKQHIKSILKEYTFRLFIAFFSTFVTFYLWTEGGLHATIVNQILITWYSLLFSHFEDVFCAGSFAGMTAPVFFYNPGFIALSAFFVFISSKLFQYRFLGFGGKFGFLSFCCNTLACFIIFLFDKMSFFDYYFPLIDHEYYEIACDNKYLIIFGPLVSCISCGAAYIMEKNMKHFNKLAAAHITGAFICLFFNLIKIKIGNWTYAYFYCNFTHVGILVALTKTDFFKSFPVFETQPIIHYLIMGYVAGFIGLGLNGVMTVGGKNGTISFIITNIYVRGFRYFYSRNQMQSKKEQETQGNKIFEMELSSPKKGTENILDISDGLGTIGTAENKIFEMELSSPNQGTEIILEISSRGGIGTIGTAVSSAKKSISQEKGANEEVRSLQEAEE